jgi:hypothetical protein
LSSVETKYQLWFPDGCHIELGRPRRDVYQEATSGGGGEDAILQSSDNKLITDIAARQPGGETIGSRTVE